MICTKISKIVCLFSCIIICCGFNIKDFNKQSTVEDIIRERTQENTLDNLKKVQPNTKNRQEKTYNVTTNLPAVDFDLTKMNKDLVYAMIFQTLVDPEKYIGKTFKMKGFYNNIFDEKTGKYFHFCVVEDALGCCLQGIEFSLKDENKKNPELGSEILIQGVFASYKDHDEGEEFLSYYIKDANMVLLNSE